MSTKYPQYPNHTDEQVEALTAAFHVRRDTAAQELLDIVFESEMLLGMLHRLASHGNEGHLPRIVELQKRSCAVLSKIYKSTAEV
jgi:hypothetical protein